MLKPISSIMSAKGSIAVFDDAGQIAELQESWIIAWAKRAESLGYDPTSCDIEMIDSKTKARIFRTDEGFNYRLL